ncbi:hypothetical protein FKP32DRAFT_1585508, partial [Trametes sanguinea]
QYLSQRLVHAAVKALVYEVEGSRPQQLLLASRDGWDPACGCAVHSADLDIDAWFLGEQKVQAINCLPGTRCRLANGYDIITLSREFRRSGTSQPNQVVQRLFSLEWPGAIIVVKRGQRHRGGAVNITSPEVSLINSVVHRYGLSSINIP